MTDNQDTQINSLEEAVGNLIAIRLFIELRDRQEERPVMDELTLKQQLEVFQLFSKDEASYKEAALAFGLPDEYAAKEAVKAARKAIRKRHDEKMSAIANMMLDELAEDQPEETDND